MEYFWKFISPLKYVIRLRGTKRMFSVHTETLRTFSVKELVTLKPLQQKIMLQGWVHAVRKQKSITFINVSDGSCLDTLQVVDENSNKKPSCGSAVLVTGTLVNSTHEKQEVELKCETLTIVGDCDGAKYPFSANQDRSIKHSRKHLHFRPRLKSFGALLRIRSAATFAIHRFFQENGFLHVNTPIITSNDCEGGGDVFSVQLGNHALAQGLDFKHYFDIPAYLTVSGQLSLEAAACAVSNVYTFGPAFRAENARTRRHLSEFQMIEVEKAFVTELDELLRLSESLFKTSTEYIMTTCCSDVELYQRSLRPNYNEQIEKILKLPFVQMTYSEAVEVIQKNQDALQNGIKWGEKLQSEHEDFLLKYCNNIPLFLMHYPITNASFYMKKSSDETVSCFDLIAPFGGEICGGSLREDDKNLLEDRIKKTGLNIDPLLWYLELREFGSVPHGGFGMGFDRYLQTVLGISNIREAVPFPRWVHHCQM